MQDWVYATKEIMCLISKSTVLAALSFNGCRFAYSVNKHVVQMVPK